MFCNNEKNAYSIERILDQVSNVEFIKQKNIVLFSRSLFGHDLKAVVNMQCAGIKDKTQC